jgi:hypothetical protein
MAWASVCLECRYTSTFLPSTECPTPVYLANQYFIMNKMEIRAAINKMEAVINNAEVSEAHKSLLRDPLIEAKRQLAALENGKPASTSLPGEISPGFPGFDPDADNDETTGVPISGFYDFGLVDLDNDEEPSRAAAYRIRSLPEIPIEALESKESFENYLREGNLEFDKTYRFPSHFYYRLIKLLETENAFEYILEENPFLQSEWYDVHSPLHKKTSGSNNGWHQRIMSFKSMDSLYKEVSVEIGLYIEDFKNIEE